MMIASLVIICIALAVILMTILLYRFMIPTKYFKNAASDAVLDGEGGFYIRKHTTFRLLFLVYSITHHLLNIISVVSAMVSIYMVLDSSSDNIRAIILLVSAVSTNHIFGLRLDRTAAGYVEAMRILENEILNYLQCETKGLSKLQKANDEAEQYIANRFF